MDKQSRMQHMPIQYEVTPNYQTAQIVPPIAHAGTFQQSPTSSYVHAAGHAFSLSAHQNQLSYQHQLHQNLQQHLHHQQKQQIENFWVNQMQGIEQAVDFRNHSLPLARIKKIMKSDEDVRMISAEAPVVFAKACEMFINELTLRAWIHTEENKRRTLQKNDIAAAIARTDVFDFLVDIVPRDELKEDQAVINLGNPTSSLSVGSNSSNAAGATTSFPFYYLPNQHSGPHGVIVGKPMDPAIYMQQPRSPVAYMHNMLQLGHVHTDQSIRSPNSD